MKTLLSLFLMLAVAMGMIACGDKGSDRSTRDTSRDGYRGYYDYRNDDYYNRSYMPTNQFPNGMCPQGNIYVYTGNQWPLCTSGNGINTSDLMLAGYWWNNMAYSYYVPGASPMYTGYYIHDDGNYYDYTDPDHWNPNTCGMWGGALGLAAAYNNTSNPWGILFAGLLGNGIGNTWCESRNRRIDREREDRKKTSSSSDDDDKDGKKAKKEKKKNVGNNTGTARGEDKTQKDDVPWNCKEMHPTDELSALCH